MTHTHENHHHDEFYLDQLCLVALSGAFGAICLTMALWNTDYLNRILAPQFHPLVLWSGIVLTIMFVARSIVLWRISGKPRTSPKNDQAHAHSDNKSDHDHDHRGEHQHDHDHGWAPWRYVVLLVPVILFLLDLPRPKMPRFTAPMDLSSEAASYGFVVAAGFTPTTQLLFAASPYLDEINDADYIEFKVLEEAAYYANTRAARKGQAIEVYGQFAPTQQGTQYFRLGQFRMMCCGGDMKWVDIPVICREPVTGFENGEWITVKGWVEFQERAYGQQFETRLRVPRSSCIKSRPAPAKPYFQ